MSDRHEDEEAKPEWISPDEKPPAEKEKTNWPVIILALLGIVLVLGANLVPNFIRAHARGLTACKSNLKNIGTAMEMYSTDHRGKYPASMGQLTPNYLKTIPICPQNGADAYQMWTGADAPGNTGYAEYYYVSCTEGHSRVSVSVGYPAYNGVIGLIERSPRP